MARVIDDFKQEGLWVKSKAISGITHYTKAGQKWRAMMDRCLEKETQNLAYVGCTVSDNFKDFQFFAEWCQKQIGYQEYFCLDKDLLAHTSKQYSENSCVFLPIEINNVLLKCHNRRGDYPLGVVYRKDNRKFRYQLNMGGKFRYKSGNFNNSESAFHAYKVHKEIWMKEIANKWRDQIDPRAYEALMNYTVEITD